jgi:hypothetical protein
MVLMTGTMKDHWQDCTCLFCISAGKDELRRLAAKREEAEYNLAQWVAAACVLANAHAGGNGGCLVHPTAPQGVCGWW